MAKQLLLLFVSCNIEVLVWIHMQDACSLSELLDFLLEIAFNITFKQNMVYIIKLNIRKLIIEIFMCLKNQNISYLLELFKFSFL